MSKPFSFGSLGQSTGASGTPTTNPFASATSGATTTQSGSIFGSGSTTTASPFGAAAGASKPSPFGNSASNPGSGASTPSLFGASTGNAGGGSSLFGSTSNTTATAPSSGLFSGSGTTTQGSTMFGGSGGGFSFGTKKDDGKGAATPVVANFGTPNKENAPASSGLFGGSQPSTQSLSTPTITSAPAGSTTPGAAKPGQFSFANSTTPAATKTGLFSFANSTTPAGPPPAEPKAAGSALFGEAQPSSGGLFGSKTQEAATNPPSSQPGGLFGGITSGGSSLFGGMNKPPVTGASVASSTAPSAPKPTFSFPSSTSASAQPSTNSATAPNPFGAATSGASAPSVGGLSFGAPKAPATSTAPAAPSSLFGSTTSSSIPAVSAVTAAPGLFSSLGKPAASGSTPATAIPATTSATSTPSLFGGLGGLGAPKPTEATNGTAPASSAPEASKSATATTAAAAAPGGLGASTTAPSTTGPAPQLSRLKNKTMDEIILRWASDLSNYQTEFQEQAAKVASWDRLLVENGDKIQKLYTSTFEAERASAEVERQLANVENQQDELAAWLTRYESEVDKMFDERVGDSLHQGPDQERERTYKLAEKLTDRLDEMGKDLTNMIQEINTASTSLSKTSKSDDPLSQIVRVLNGHLSQLQWIDQNAAVLQAKVAAAQKASQSIGSSGQAGGESERADDFYRSYMSRR